MRVCSMYIVSIMPSLIAQSMKLPDLILLIYPRRLNSYPIRSPAITRDPPVKVALFLQECQEWDAFHSAENM